VGDVALIQVVGRLTKDAEAEALQNNADRVSVKFTVASNYYEKGKDQRPAAFYEARMFMPRDRFNNVSQFLRKGAAVLLYGQLRPRETQDQSGKKTWLNVEECDFAPLEAPKAGAQPIASGPAAAPAPSQYVTDPKYPGYYFDRQTNQWVQGNPPVAAPPPPPAPPAQPPLYQPPAPSAPPAAPPGWNPGGAPSAPPAAAPPASGGGGYGGPPPGQSPI